MFAKAALLVCAQALLVPCISAQCLGAIPALAAPLGAPCGAWGITPAAGLAASNGAGLAVASASPIPPVGVSVASENAIEGALAVAGALPFLGTVGLEGILPTAGAGAVAYNCGSGIVGITAEDLAAAPLGIGAPLGLTGLLGIGAPLGLAGPVGLTGPIGLAGPLGVAGLGLGCGCGLI